MPAVAVIPARGGSKRIPRKNIKPFHGKPLIAYSIQAALAAGCFERVVVSTDDSDIANVALRFGAEVPFMRPQKLADDHSTTGAVMAQVLSQLAVEGYAPDKACCIYATAPMIQVQDVLKGGALLDAEDLDYVFSAATFAFPIQRAIRLKYGQRVEMVSPENMQVRSQDLEEMYHDAGQFYWGKRESFLEQRKLFSDRSAAVVLPRSRVQDIDTPEDWGIAEAMFEVLSK